MEQPLDRTEKRYQQKENKFFARLSEYLNLPKDEAREAFNIIAGNLVKRVTSEEAGDFLSQMPFKVRDILEDLPAGPDKSITAQTILDELEQMELGERRPQDLVGQTWNFLADFLHEESENKGELSDLFGQLPQDIRNLITESRSS